MFSNTEEKRTTHISEKHELLATYKPPDENHSNMCTLFHARERN